jgi:Fe-Mn family superoxide dismutase
MPQLENRRRFLLQTGKAGLGLWAGLSIPPLVSSCAVLERRVKGPGTTGFKQEPLQYSYGALNNAIDAATMELHYTKHAAAYAANLQDAALAEGVNTSKPLEDVLRNIGKYSATMRNNGGGHYNHELFWKTMHPRGGGLPSGNLAAAIDASFNSFEAFKKAFSDAANGHFGSGWVWLVLDGDKKLRMGTTPNQDNPLMPVAPFKGLPIMCLDVWEHAYYLRYQNKRSAYIENWWRVVHWDFIGKRYAAAV